jgi:hypothetical protein
MGNIFSNPLQTLENAASNPLQATTSAWKSIDNPQTLAAVGATVGEIYGGPAGAAAGSAAGSAIGGGTLKQDVQYGATAGLLDYGATAGYDYFSGGSAGASAGIPFSYGGESSSLSSDQSWFDQQALQKSAQGYGDYGTGVGMGTSGGLEGMGAGNSGGMGGMLKGILPYAGAANIVGGLYGLYSSGKAANQANKYGNQISALEANPASITGTPGYAAGEQAVRNTDASTGYGHSGKEQLDLFNYGNQAYTNQINTLSQLQQNAQSGVPTATGSIGGIGMGLGMMAAGGSFDSLLSYL